MNKVIVIGGAGYIGSHTCKLLCRAGYSVVSIDNLSTSTRFHPYNGKAYLTDIVSNQTTLTELFKIHRDAQAVIHFAAKAYVGESLEKPLEYYENNVTGTINVLKAMRHLNNPRLVFSSSCATYGMPDKELPITESMSQRPINPYGTSKLMVEQILQDIEHTDGIKSVSLRYFNAAGADPEGELGEEHNPETHVIPILLDVIAGSGPRAFVINGDEHDTPDGTCVRDYIHVMDLARAHIQAMNYLINGGSTEYFNLGTGVGTSVFELLDLCVKADIVSDIHNIPIKIGAARLGDPPYLVADATKAKVGLGWEPQYTVEDALRHAWAWRNRK